MLFFAYPFGARDEWMQPLLQKNGIQVSVLTNTGTASIRRRLTDLPRYRITMDTKLSDILPANPERLARYYRAGAHADHDQE